MALSQKQKIAVRRHLGIPFAGTAQAGRLFGWRFQIHVEDLEYKMNNMQPPEEQLLTGVSLGSYRIDGRPAVGDALSLTIADAVNAYTVPYTVVSSDISAPTNGSSTFQVALGSALAVNGSNAYIAGYQAIPVQPADLFTAPMFTSYFAELIIVGPSPNAFTLTASRTGSTNILVESSGAPSPVSAVVNGVTVYGYLALLDALAMQPARADVSLWVQGGTDGNFRKDEVGARNRLYRYYCEMLSRDLGGREYVNIINRGARGGGATA